MELTHDRTTKGSNAQISQKTHGATKDQHEEVVTQALVTAGHAGKRRARSRARRVQTDQCEEDRGFTQAVRGTQFTPQDRRLSLGALDADLLYQPRRQEFAQSPARPAATREDRIE